MRNLSIIFVMLFLSIALFAQEEKASYIMNDGSVQTYNLSDIEDITTIKGQAIYEMKIYLKDSAPVSYLSNQFDSVKYSRDSYNNYVYKVFSGANQFSHLLANIDSICYNNLEAENTIKICNQTWMVKNLDVDTYRNGEPIRHCQTNEEWIDANSKKEGAWCYYNNSDSLGAIYGKLYNWYAVIDPRGLAPDGWHVPTDDEWTELGNCLGGSSGAGGKLKSTGTIEGGDGLWRDPNTGATNESGFSAFPGGLRDANDGFYYIGGCGVWWTTSTVSYMGQVFGRGLYYNNTGVYRLLNLNRDSFSVRCVRD